MANGFRHETGNKYGDYISAREDNPGEFWLATGDWGDMFMIVLTRSDLDAIIEKLTALRDGVVQ